MRTKQKNNAHTLKAVAAIQRQQQQQQQDNGEQEDRERKNTVHKVEKDNGNITRLFRA